MGGGCPQADGEGLPVARGTREAAKPSRACNGEFAGVAPRGRGWARMAGGAAVVGWRGDEGWSDGNGDGRAGDRQQADRARARGEDGLAASAQREGDRLGGGGEPGGERRVVYRCS